MYYIIKDNNPVMSDKEHTLKKFYPDSTVKFINCTIDEYKEGKYKYIDNEIILNPYYQQEDVRREEEAQNAELQRQIDALELKRTRALAEPAIKDETTGQTWLEYRTEKIRELREQMNKL